MKNPMERWLDWLIRFTKSTEAGVNSMFSILPTSFWTLFTKHMAGDFTPHFLRLGMRMRAGKAAQEQASNVAWSNSDG
jgi:hypothetical protein